MARAGDQPRTTLVLGRGENTSTPHLVHYLHADGERTQRAHDLADRPWPWGDGALDEIRADADLVERAIPVADWLAECWRLLAVGGRLLLATGDGVPAGLERAAATEAHPWRMSQAAVDGAAVVELVKRAGRATVDAPTEGR